MPPEPADRREKKWEPIFFPKYYVKTGADLTIAGNELDQNDLLDSGKQVTKLRHEFDQLAEKLAKRTAEQKEPADILGKHKSFHDVQNYGKEVRRRG